MRVVPGGQGVTASHLIREAITAYLTNQDDEMTELVRQRAHLKEAVASIPRLPTGARFVDEIRTEDEMRERELEEQWHSC